MATFPAPEPQEEIQTLRIDGIPTFLAASASPLRACLMFRVGLVEEGLSRRGMTHLVEHLALAGIGEVPYRYNGMVDGLFARFIVGGRSAEVVDFFNRVTAALGNLPRERVIAESAVLRTEATNRRSGWLDAMYGYRFGTNGWGLVGVQEYGLQNPEPDEVQAWARTHFVVENAALWISGQLPAGLTINLPSGQRTRPPDPVLAIAAFPARAIQNGAGVGISMTGKRSSALRAMAGVAQRRAHTELREGAVSYSVLPSYQPLNKDEAHVAFWADALPANVERVGTGLIKALDLLAESGPRQEELDRYVDELERAEEEADAVLVWLESTAVNELLGSRPLTRAGLKDELQAITPESGREALVKAMSTALVMAPPQMKSASTRFTTVPSWSDKSVIGHSVGLNLGLSTVGRKIRLTVANDGVTFEFDQSRVVTVWFDRCSAMLTWADGSRTLFGIDGFRLHIAPQDWHTGPQVIRWIDEHISAERVVAMGDRPKPDPEVIVREPVYDWKTPHLAALTAGLWAGIAGAAAIEATVPNPSPGLTTSLILLVIPAVRFSVQLYWRSRAPRVRLV